MAVGLEEGIWEEGNEAGEGVEVDEGNAGAAELRREEIEDRNAIKEFWAVTKGRSSIAECRTGKRVEKTRGVRRRRQHGRIPSRQGRGSDATKAGDW
jgi:hypothetical protein